MANSGLGFLVAAGTLCALGGCGQELANLSASLGGDRVGQRGQIQVVFINNTAYRAVATFGTFDQFDENSIPDIEQFGPDDAGRTLDSGATSDVLAMTCGRVFAVGSPRLLDLVEANLGTADVQADALVPGVAFVDAAAPNAGAFEALIGVDFPCGALLILHLEEGGAGGSAFRIDFSLIPSESTR
jgi:hypothetical protein